MKYEVGTMIEMKDNKSSSGRMTGSLKNDSARNWKRMRRSKELIFGFNANSPA